MATLGSGGPQSTTKYNRWVETDVTLKSILRATPNDEKTHSGQGAITLRFGYYGHCGFPERQLRVGCRVGTSGDSRR